MTPATVKAGVLLLYLASDLLCLATPLSFDFDFSNPSSFSLRDDLRFEGDAAYHNQWVDLTRNEYAGSITESLGRVSYSQPVPLWNNLTGEVANFQTRFTFVIKLTNRSSKGDGMAFFVASYPSRLPPNSGGGGLGLFGGGSNPTASGSDRFLAFELDTFNNTWDPSDTYDHIGIDMNTIESVEHAILPSFRLDGQMTATVTYDNKTMLLDFVLKFDTDSTDAPVKLTTRADLRNMLPPEVAIGFSAATGLASELHQIVSWSFSSTLSATTTGLPSTAPGPASPTNKDDTGTKKKAIIGLVVGSIVGTLSILALVGYIVCTRVEYREDDFEKGTGPKRMKYSQLAAATHNFSDDTKLGQGGFGTVYKGFLSELRKEVAIKKLSSSSLQGFNEFKTEVKTICHVRHRNLVELIGWCKRRGELLLVYELVPNGNLQTHLYSEDPVLSWSQRYNIIKDVGSALVYLHNECNPSILHRDIKPSNVLLDCSFNAKLSDFGLSRSFSQSKRTFSTSPAGTIGYLDPECIKRQRVSTKSDVYSFGVMMLELSCWGKTLEQIWDLYRSGMIVQAVDMRLEKKLRPETATVCGCRRTLVCPS